MATFDTTSFQTQVTSDERGLSTWLVWLLLLLLGLVGWGLSFYQIKQEEGSVASTLAVASELQNNAVLMQSEASLATFGNQGSLDRLSQSRSRVQSDLSLLERGGFANTNDKYPVLVNAGGVPQPLAKVSQQFGAFSGTLQPILGASDRLNQATDAETDFPKVVAQLRQISASIARSPHLSQGAWDRALSPIVSDLTRNELDNIQALFAPSDGGSVLAKQWSDFLSSRAQDATTLAQLATKDATLTQAERTLLANLANRAKLLSRHATALFSTQDARFQARKSLDEIRNQGQLLQESIQSLIATIKNIHSTPSTWTYLFWGSLVMSIVGFLGVLRSFWVMGYERWRAQQDGYRGSVLFQAVEKSTRELRRVLALETNNEKLLQPPDSPIFPLISMINQSLALKTEASDIIEEQSRLLQKGLFDLEGSSSALIGKTVEHKKVAQEMAEDNTQHSEMLAVLCQSLEEVVQSFQQTVDASNKGGAISQEISWKMQSLRENTQSTAKRIKRLGEGTQTIGVSSDLIKDMIRKVKVLALNLAVEAANQGEQGKTFASLARELERLAITAEQSVKDIDNHILVIQTDAKETVSSMENGIVDVVEVAKLSGETISSFRDQDRMLERLKTTLESCLSRLQGATLGVEKTSEQATMIAKDIDKQEEQLREIRSKNDQFRSVLSSFRRWLNTVGRDI